MSCVLLVRAYIPEVHTRLLHLKLPEIHFQDPFEYVEHIPDRLETSPFQVLLFLPTLPFVVWIVRDYLEAEAEQREREQRKRYTRWKAEEEYRIGAEQAREFTRKSGESSTRILDNEVVKEELYHHDLSTGAVRIARTSTCTYRNASATNQRQSYYSK